MEKMIGGNPSEALCWRVFGFHSLFRIISGAGLPILSDLARPEVKRTEVKGTDGAIAIRN
jgi:hypothetical protein